MPTNLIFEAICLATKAKTLKLLSVSMAFRTNKLACSFLSRSNICVLSQSLLRPYALIEGKLEKLYTKKHSSLWG
jgi:hypothetical protein